MDWILEHMSRTEARRIGTRRFTDLVYVDDTSCFVTSTQRSCQMSIKFQQLSFNIWPACLLAEDQNPEYRFRRTATRHHCWCLTDCHHWTCSLTVPLPHRSVTRSPSRSELEAMSMPPSEQVAWPTPQGQQYTSCWSLETSRHAWTLGVTLRSSTTAH